MSRNALVTFIVDSSTVVERQNSIGVPAGRKGQYPEVFKVYLPRFYKNGEPITMITYLSNYRAEIKTAKWLVENIPSGYDVITI